MTVAGDLSGSRVNIQNQTYSIDTPRFVGSDDITLSVVRNDADSPNKNGGLNVTGNVTSTGDLFVQNAGSQGLTVTSDLVEGENVHITNASGDMNLTGSHLRGTAGTDTSVTITNSNTAGSMLVNNVASIGNVLIENSGTGSLTVAGEVSGNRVNIQNQTYSIDTPRFVGSDDITLSVVRNNADSPNKNGGLNVSGSVKSITGDGDLFVQNAGSEGLTVTGILEGKDELFVTNAGKDSDLNVTGTILGGNNVTISNVDSTGSLNITGNVDGTNVRLENSGTGSLTIGSSSTISGDSIKIENQISSIQAPRVDNNGEIILALDRTYPDMSPIPEGGLNIEGDVVSDGPVKIVNGGQDGITIDGDITTNGDTWIDNKGGSNVEINGDITNNSGDDTLISNGGDRVPDLDNLDRETNYTGEDIIINGDINTKGDVTIANDGKGGNTTVNGNIDSGDGKTEIVNSNNADDITINGDVTSDDKVVIETGDGNINITKPVGPNTEIHENENDIDIVRTRDDDQGNETLHIIRRPKPDIPVIPPPINPNTPVIADNDPTRLVYDRKLDESFLQLKRESIRFYSSLDKLNLLSAVDGVENVLDISKTGLAVKTDGNLKLNDTVKISFEYKGIEIEAQAQVMRVDENTNIAGLRFVNVDNLTENKILYLSMLREAEKRTIDGDDFQLTNSPIIKDLSLK